MRRIISFPLLEGETILVEVDEPNTSPGLVPAGREEDTIERASRTFEHALDTIKPVAEAVINKLSSLPERPSEVEVKFGLKLTAEAGAIIAAVSAEANFEISLTWTAKDNDVMS